METETEDRGDPPGRQKTFARERAGYFLFRTPVLRTLLRVPHPTVPHSQLLRTPAK